MEQFRKNTGLIAAAGLLTLAALGSPYFFTSEINRDSEENVVVIEENRAAENTQVSSRPTTSTIEQKVIATTQTAPHQEKEDFESEYNGAIYSCKNNAAKQTVYIIPHMDLFSIKGMKSSNPASTQWAAHVQRDVYRILENLHRTRGLEIVALDSLQNTDRIDIDDPKIFEKGFGDKIEDSLVFIKSRIEDDGDPALLVQITKKRHSGALLYALLHQDVYGVGVINEDIDKRARDSLDVLLNSSISPEEMREKIKKDWDGYRKKRTAFALSSILESANTLYNEDRVKSRDVAIPIEYMALFDFPDICEDAINGKIPYNVVIINTKSFQRE